jgi:hypothetical protein
MNPFFRVWRLILEMVAEMLARGRVGHPLRLQLTPNPYPLTPSSC